MNNDGQEPDCAICLQKYHHPTKLPCGHVFCFLCVKGIAILSKKCAICRSQIPLDYFDHPVLLDDLYAEEICSDGDIEKYHWYYEGRNGWWKYDERSNIDLENAFSSNELECLLLLAGTLYCVDFQNMIQFRRSDPTKRRRVKRDVPTLPSKGVAGIKKLNIRPTQNLENTNDDANTINIENAGNENGMIVVANGDVNIISDVVIRPTSPQLIHTIDDLVNRLSHVNLTNEEQSRSEEDGSQASTESII